MDLGLGHLLAERRECFLDPFDRSALPEWKFGAFDLWVPESAFEWSVNVVDVGVGSCGGEVGASKLTSSLSVGRCGMVRAAWRYSLMSPLQVRCRRIGRPG